MHPGRDGLVYVVGSTSRSRRPSASRARWKLDTYPAYSVNGILQLVVSFPGLQTECRVLIADHEVDEHLTGDKS